MVIHSLIVTKMCLLRFSFKSLNVPTQILMSWNGLALPVMCWVHHLACHKGARLMPYPT
jgi:hypothetical protein